MTDLERFKEICNPDKFKLYPGKLEIRAANLDVELHAARKIIADNEFNLVAITDGQLTSYRAFEVQEIN